MADDLASRVLGGEAGTGVMAPAAGGAAVVAGFQGDSGNANVQRVYLTPDCSSAYVEFPADAVVTSQEIGTEGRSTFPGTAYWLPKNQELTCWISVPTSAKSLDAVLLADATRSSGNGVAGIEPGSERWVGAAIAAGTTAWELAGQAGLQDDIIKGGISVGKKIGKTISSWF